jgi:hypothetical protein
LAAAAAASGRAVACAAAQALSNTWQAQSWQAPHDDATRRSSCSTSKQRVPVCTAATMSRSETRWQRQTIMVQRRTVADALHDSRNANPSQ